MSGHSKWSTIKRKKGALDAKRGKIFTKLAREIQVAARVGGGDPDANPRLRLALAAASAANMPKDNQERAIRKGLGELDDGAQVEEVRYEGRGPAGVAFVLECMTDNRNRTVSELRHLLSKAGGELGTGGSATYMFDRRGVVVLPRTAVDEDTLMERALEAGADEFWPEGDVWVVVCAPEELGQVQGALDDLGPEAAELRWIPKPEFVVELSGEAAEQVAQTWAKLDDHDDVQEVYTNAKIPAEVMEAHGL
ncbi:MAG: YebC/PmpR family DNA-binding transcriptional regulator [Deltaproteobacteria bacterium]|nr:MAG: YebC/PmpR family DNA-binding transcriptional regulator [Deltaproteobacteria bacterium]